MYWCAPASFLIPTVGSEATQPGPTANGSFTSGNGSGSTNGSVLNGVLAPPPSSPRANLGDNPDKVAAVTPYFKRSRLVSMLPLPATRLRPRSGRGPARHV